MSWLKLAFGLIREAAGTELGQDVINNIRTSARKKPPESSPAPGPAPLDVEALIAEHRQQVDRNLESIVETLNRQNARLNESLRQQRIWNYALATGAAIALVTAIVAAF